MELDTKLLPCPHCGGEGYCSDCECTGPITNGRCRCGSARIAPSAHHHPLPLKEEVERVLEQIAAFPNPPTVSQERARALLSRIRAGAQEPFICDVLIMQHSSGFPDYFTRVKHGERCLTTYMSKIKGRCEYHAAEFDWLLNGAEKPDILAFDYTEPEGLADYLKSIAAPSPEAKGGPRP